MTKQQEQKKAKGKCILNGCHRNHAPGKTLCYKHHMQRWRIRNPILAAYYIMKWNSKIRRKEFHLSVEEFEEFCLINNYIPHKGIHAQDLTIDRIDHTKGYSIDNIQVLTKRENVQKEHLELDPEFVPVPVDKMPF